MLKRFFIYGFIGWGIEIFWTSLESLINGDLRLIGHSNFWMLFVYGLAVFMEPLHDIIKSWNIVFRGLIWTAIIWGIEYTTGLVLHMVLGVYPWFYKGPFSIDGLVTLAFAPAWFVAGLIFERIHRTLDAYRVQ